MDVKRSYVFAGLFLAAIVIWLLSGLLAGRDDEVVRVSGDGNRSAPVAVRVRDVTASLRPDILVVQGRTEADRAVTLRAETFGRVAEIGARKGAQVEEGEMIARLDPGDRPARLAEARAEVAQRRLQYEAATRLGEREFASRTRVAEAKAQLEQAEARLAAIQEEIGDATIRAPFAGILDRRAVEIGDYLQVGGEVATIVDLDPIAVVAQVPETAMAGLRPGLPGEVRLTDGRVIQGEVTYVGASAGADTRTYRIELEAPNSGRVPAGMTAELRVARPGSQVHQVPASALTLDDDGRVGLMLVSGGAAEFVPVRVLGEDREGVWLGGLPDQAKIITVGQEYVTPGQRVIAVPETESGGR